MEYKVSEVVKIISGGTPKRKNSEYWNGEIPWLSVKDFNNKNRLVHETEEQITEAGLNNSATTLVSKGTVVISARGTVGELCQVAKSMTFNQSCFGLEAISKYTTNEYIYYWFKYKTNYIKSNTHGSVFDTINRKTFENLYIYLPNISYQKQVVNILKTLDNKIEINQNIIANLEELSQTLFKRWFVDFEFPDENGNPYKSSRGEMIDSELGKIPKNWKCSKIKDINAIISDHVANGSFKSLKENVQFTEELNDKYAIFARNIDLKKGDNRFEKYVTMSSYEFLRKSHLHGHEVIISNVGDVGSVYLSPILNRPMVLGNNQIFINSDEKNVNYYFYLFFKSSIGKNLIDSITSGSVQMKFNKTDLRNSLIVFPCKNDMNNLIKVIKKNIYSIENKKSENMQLTQLRDTLLPKLMSGEIEIPDDIEVNEDELSI
ncbi:restriction endonuclease subunit S [Staphylococcus xylosus]|uniref:restriction endonuclease subunit S n=1 Tax=Staphylococcus xylosus TaxID=1288 RepID=UPI003F549AA1